MNESIRNTTTQSPSIQGSTPVSEVLGRIQVRDPHHTPSGQYGRRITDYENHWSMLQNAAFIIVAALVVGTSAMYFLQNYAGPWKTRPVSTPTMVIPKTPKSLNQPKEIHPPVHRAQRMPTPRTEATLPAPDNLRARFMGPRQVDFQWDSLGSDYIYRLYQAPNAMMLGASPLTEGPIRASMMNWSPEDGVQTVWVAVKGINREGSQTGFGRPLQVSFPY